ncbi:MAG TPA: S41 family peptidase [Pirellulaceae bacterium]|nr:S41 family peptidase [Pirellulaceae bacterium]HMO93545.1 S41 family peptidase [Pirellulaceae bacterium]HMP70343.1 S41 family peptidase [Pirellulaceae bacterium]
MLIVTLTWCSCGLRSALMAQPDNLLVNGNLEWDGNRIPGWEIAQGAGGNGKNSLIRSATNGALELSGDATIRVWNYVGQYVPVAPGEYFRLSFSAAAEALQLEKDQFNNCYIGSFFLVGQNTVGNSVFRVERPEMAPHEIIFRVPDNADGMRIMIFLSMTGKLRVAHVKLERLSSQDSFDVLIRNMDRYYSYFHHKGIDWRTLAARYRERAIEAADTNEFQDVILDMLAELKDTHVWIAQGQERLSRYRSTWTPNFDFNLIDRQLKNLQHVGGVATLGRTSSGVGYIRLNSLVANAAESEQLIVAVHSLMDAPAIIVDLRANSGGDEKLARTVAGNFTDKSVVYAKQRFRLNNNHDEFYEVEREPLRPANSKTYKGNVFCLIGPGTVSSGEGMAKMFAAIPGVTLLGQATRGASGNPQPVLLPNGVVVYYSRWVDLDMQGNIIEDRGIQPDIIIEHSSGDPTFKQALELADRK